MPVIALHRCRSCLRRKNAPTWSDLRELEKQYQLIKQRQKQAKVILNSAYLHGLNANSAKPKVPPLIFPPRSPPVFNHLLMGPLLAKIDCATEPPATFSGGAVKVAATVIQPANHTMSRLRELLREISEENESESKYDTSSIDSVSPQFVRERVKAKAQICTMYSASYACAARDLAQSAERHSRMCVIRSLETDR
ncbi:unnamed protein product [Strongylus vulgaris]|uniref:Uncharacterized protein n=1 Tax=Strongylus vulgaris TaxID=40348 RepID=A0A3P7K5V6_STRVU|nr:unnamed protein product [Strongylus vulgaris]